MNSLILASNSPRRRELLAALGYVFRVRSEPTPELTEWPVPEQLPVLNARRKARAVARQEPDAVVIGADTVILFQDRIIGKPVDSEDAERILRQLSGATHRVCTGICIVGNGREESFPVFTEVTFKAYTAADIRHYLSIVPVLDKAGAYAIQDHGDMLVDHIDGSLSNVIGLPQERLQSALAGFL